MTNFNAKDWLKDNKDRLILQFADPKKFLPEKNPVTTFMAGTPGAGKTEFSIKLLESFSTPVVRIDPDEIREEMTGYNGQNSDIFQPTVDKMVNVLYDHVRHNNQSVLMDGTFSYADWRKNLEVSLKRTRKVEIYYLYQEPAIAWDYCKKRADKPNGRVVPPQVFVKSYIESINNVEAALKEFPQITVYFAENDYTKNLKDLKINIRSIIEVLPRIYTENELRSILGVNEDEST